jgi:hypothetical protein
LYELQRRGYQVRRVYGQSAIDQARNRMATDALRDGFQETMWIDADIAFDPDDVERLRRHQLPIVSGLYPQKGSRVLASFLLPGTTELIFGQGGGLVEILYAAAGFLLVQKQVYTKIQEGFALPTCNQRFGRPTIPFFEPSIVPDEYGNWYLAEDFAFSERARQCGFKIYADTTIRLGHIGTYTYTWEDAGSSKPRHATYRLRLQTRAEPTVHSPDPARAEQGNTALETPEAPDVRPDPVQGDPVRRSVVRRRPLRAGDAPQGVLYIATGAKYIAEACRSAMSCKQQMPELATAILCDDPSQLQSDWFDIVTPLSAPNHSFLDKVLGIQQSPFAKTLYLDSDTLAIEPFGEVFELLQRFDLAAAHAPWRWTHAVDGCPECFPELNAGVILYQSCPRVQVFFHRWESLYRAHHQRSPRMTDQPAFRQALYESDVRLAVLTPEYNLRTVFPAFAGGHAKVKILHGRPPSLDRLCPIVNGGLGPRVFSGPGPTQTRHQTAIQLLEE